MGWGKKVWQWSGLTDVRMDWGRKERKMFESYSCFQKAKVKAVKGLPAPEKVMEEALTKETRAEREMNLSLLTIF